MCYFFGPTPINPSSRTQEFWRRLRASKVLLESLEKLQGINFLCNLMGHRRIKMEVIENHKTRMLTFKKRKNNLFKKTREFSILCNVSACIVVFPPNSSDKISKPESWPSDPDEVTRIINRYKASDLQKRSYHISDYFGEKIKKVDSELAKLHELVCRAKHPPWDDGLNDLSKDQLAMFLARIEVKLDNVDQRLCLMKENMYIMDRVAENFSFGNVHSGDSQLVSDFQGQFDPKMIDIGEHISIGHSSSLQGLPNVAPLNFQLPLLGFEQKQDPFSGSSSFDVGTNAHNSGSWMWDNVVSSNGVAYNYSSMSYISPLMQQFQNYHQSFPTSGFVHPVHSTSQASAMEAGIEFGGNKEQKNFGF